MAEEDVEATLSALNLVQYHETGQIVPYHCEKDSDLLPVYGAQLEADELRRTAQPQPPPQFMPKCLRWMPPTAADHAATAGAKSTV